MIQITHSVSKKVQTIVATLTLLLSLTALANAKTADQCHAVVRVCKEGPGVVAFIASDCYRSGLLVVGYKNHGVLAQNSSVDAVVMFNSGNATIAQKVLRLTPDWNRLGLMTPAIALWGHSGRTGRVDFESISVAFSNGKDSWDSNSNSNGSYPPANYHFPIGSANNSPGCKTVLADEGLYIDGVVPFAAWRPINEAMAADNEK